MLRFLAGRNNGAGTPFQNELRRATEATTAAVPKDALLAIAQASQSEDGRREIMQHIALALCEPSRAKWRRVFLAMSVLEDLMKTGSSELTAETLIGVHFDVANRMAMLEKYECSDDLRVQGLVRRKALQLRTDFAEAAAGAEGEARPHQDDDGDEGRGPPCAAAAATRGAAPSSAAQPSAAGKRRERREASGRLRTVGGTGGMVYVGHNEDTDDSEDERQVRNPLPKPAAERPRLEESKPPPPVACFDLLGDADSTSSGGSGPSPSTASASPPSPPPAAPLVDLLG